MKLADLNLREADVADREADADGLEARLEASKGMPALEVVAPGQGVHHPQRLGGLTDHRRCEGGVGEPLLRGEKTVPTLPIDLNSYFIMSDSNKFERRQPSTAG